MLNLNSVLSVKDIADVHEYTKTRVKSTYNVKAKEAITLYEQNYLDEAKIKELCEEAYGCTLFEPRQNYIPESIVELFRGTNYVPANYLSVTKVVTVVYLPDLEPRDPNHTYNFSVEKLPTTPHYYLKQYQELYGKHDMLQKVPSKQLFMMIIQEAIRLNAADITISTMRERAEVYYNVRKRKVVSQRMLVAEDIPDMITYICIKSPYQVGSRQPKYVDIDVDTEHRGRVVINTKFKGNVITIRLLPNEAFKSNITDIGLTEKASEWMRKNILDSQPGLRLIVGETMSGKNTDALALLHELAEKNTLKIVSVEMPVEQELPGVEQINTTNIEEYSGNIKSLIHQNPDFIYITEMKDETALETVKITNTGKRVLSTCHANSVAETITRLTDMTGFSSNRIIQSLHSVVMQRLLRDDKKDRVFPRVRYLRFTDSLKASLYDKPIGEIINIIEREEDGDEELKQI